MSWQVAQGDSRELLQGLAPGSVDAVVCDPPYELGFMGRNWDASGIAYDVGLWRGVLRALKPGGHLLAFGGTRTYHRMACAIEDAGFEIRDSLHWIYGSGFPKSLDAEKATGDPGWSGWGTALKPAHEPIVMARKPLAGTVAHNVTEHGTGAINVDGCRVGDDRRHNGSAGLNVIFGQMSGRETSGRWPPNILHDGSPVVVAGFPVVGGGRSGGVAGWQRGGYVGGTYEPIARTGYDDQAGSAARFFPCFRYEAKASRSEREAGIGHLPPSTRGDVTGRDEESAGQNHARSGVRATGEIRNVHPTVKPIAMMRWLCRLVTPPGGLVLDPFTGSGTTGCAAVLEGFRFLGFELSEEYATIARARIAHWEAAGGLSPEQAQARDQEGAPPRGEQLGLFGGKA